MADKWGASLVRVQMKTCKGRRMWTIVGAGVNKNMRWPAYGAHLRCRGQQKSAMASICGASSVHMPIKTCDGRHVLSTVDADVNESLQRPTYVGHRLCRCRRKSAMTGICGAPLMQMQMNICDGQHLWDIVGAGVNETYDGPHIRVTLQKLLGHPR